MHVGANMAPGGPIARLAPSSGVARWLYRKEEARVLVTLLWIPHPFLPGCWGCGTAASVSPAVIPACFMPAGQAGAQRRRAHQDAKQSMGYVAARRIIAQG